MKTETIGIQDEDLPKYYDSDSQTFLRRKSDQCDKEIWNWMDTEELEVLSFILILDIKKNLKRVWS